MKILNKFIWSKKEPSNKNDIWFDGSTWRMYTEEAWQSFTLPVDAADKVAKVLENASEVYQEKLNAGYGIIIEGNTISLDDSIKYDDSDVWEAIETLQQNKVEQTQLNDYVTLDRYESTAQMLIDNINELDSIKVNKNAVATINGQSLIAGGNIVIPTGGESYDDTEIKQQLTELSEEIESNGQLIEDLQNMKIDKENDDYYPMMAVGLADNLAGVDVVDSEINFRRSGGGAITDGVARIEAIKGNSVVWNQLAFKAAKSTTMHGVTFTANSDGSITANGTASPTAYIIINPDFYTDASHRYAIFGTPNGGSNETYYFGDGNTLNDKDGNGAIVNGRNSRSNLACRVQSGVTVNNAVYRPRLIDLTQMFGAGNEPTTIEEFYQRTPMGVDLNAYNEGEVIHMDVQSIESVGVNQWDEEWELGSISAVTGENINSATQIRSKNFNEIMGGTKYALYCSSVTNSMSRIILYDKDYKLVDYWGFTPNIARIIDVPGNVRFFKVSMDATYGAKYKGDICINLSDTSINGKYFPYIKRVEDLSLVRKYFPQGMKSAGSAHDEIRYNKESGKWEKVVRIGEVDMGSLPWGRNANGSLMLMNATIADIAPALTVATYTNNILQIRYPFDTSGGTTLMTDKTIRRYSRSIYVRDDAYTDTASFKAAMAGVMLYYELAEPIVTELDEADQFKDLDYQVWNAGTEKAIAEGKSAPLAADITYGFNAIGKIKELESLVAALRAKVGI